MFQILSVLYVSSIIITSLGVLGSSTLISQENITNMLKNIDFGIWSTEQTYHYVPAGVGSSNLTDGDFTDKIKTLFSNNDRELLCRVKLSSELTTIPNITCEGAFSDDLKDSLKKINTNYSDVDAQNKVLDLVWESEVGKKMLALLSNESFGNETNTKARVQEMWFMNEEATFRRLFIDVFLGNKYQEDFNGTTTSTTDPEDGEEEDKEGSDDKFKDFTYDGVPVSWTGNYFRQIEGDLNITKGSTRQLVDDLFYLADIEVKLGGENLNSTFVVGTTFIYDFISFSMCWIYGVHLEKCIVPLPGTTAKMIEITNKTIKSCDPNLNCTDLYITCTGFNVNEHRS